jgi:hypothetical protein
LYAGQQGKCYITGEPLKIKEIEVFHKIPKSEGGNDNYNNLILINRKQYDLIYEIDINVVKTAIKTLNLGKIGIEKLMKLRKLVGNCTI